jgi:hypothetical protein
MVLSLDARIEAIVIDGIWNKRGNERSP